MNYLKSQQGIKNDFQQTLCWLTDIIFNVKFMLKIHIVIIKYKQQSGPKSYFVLNFPM